MRIRIPPAAIACALLLAATAEGQGSPRVSTVHGVVFDSLRGRPLGDARVSILGESKSTTTDSHGRFRFDDVRVGARTIAVQHAALDSLGFTGLTRRADVGRGDEVLVAVPSFATLWRSACGATKVPADSALVFGTVRDAHRWQPIAGATLTFAWTQLVARPIPKKQRVGGVVAQLIDKRWTADVTTNGRGEYVICGAPTDAPLLLVASHDSATSGVIVLPVAGLRVQRRDFSIAERQRGAIPTGAIIGLLSDESGAPFVDARVTIDDSLELRSDFDGRVAFPSVLAGTRSITVRYVGANPILSSVDVLPGDTARFSIEVPRVQTLATTFVTSEDRARMLRADLSERQIRFQRFMIDTLEIVKHSTVAELLYGRPNLSVRRRGMDVQVSMPDGRGGQCTPDVRIDGVLANDIGQVTTIPPNRLVSVEVYPKNLDLPPEYARGGVRYQCGLIAVWTRWALRLP